MESHPQNPEFRNNPETFHPCGPLSQKDRWSLAAMQIRLDHLPDLADKQRGH